MSWLKKFGKGVLTGVQIATGVAPVLQQSLPQGKPQEVIGTINDSVALIAQTIQTVEVMGQALNQPGAEKLRAATPLVAQIVLQSSAVAGHEIADPVLFNKGCEAIASGFADVLNAVKA